MRTTLAATMTALALLAGCGGGDDDTALTPSSSSTPTAEPTASASAKATATASARSSAKSTKTGSPKSGGLRWTGGTATGDALPLAAPLLPPHDPAAGYPASQLTPEPPGDVIVRCGEYEFPVERLSHPRRGTELSKLAQKAFKGYINTGPTSIVAVADEKHVLILDPYTEDNPATFDYAEGFYETSNDGRERWWTDTDYPPSTCTIARVLPGLREVNWELNPNPKPGDRSISVTFYASSCNGKSATDRIKVPILEMTKDGVRVALGEEPGRNGDKCTEPEPVTMNIDLPEPIGKQPVLNAATYPETEVL